MNKTRRLLMITMLVALGVIFHYAESLIELPGIPGVRLGFANIVGLIALYLFGFRTMVEVNLGRVLFASLLNGRLLTIGFFLSLGGTVLAMLVSGWAKRYTHCSVLGVSMLQAAFHGLGQVLVVMGIYSQSAMVFYLPVLMILAIPTGLFTGYIAHLVIQHLSRRRFI